MNLTKDGHPKKWFKLVWTIGSEGNGKYRPFRERMIETKRIISETEVEYIAWDSYDECMKACREYSKKTV